MPIEFRCPQCGKLLRTAHDTAGKQARCPACGSVQTIPDRSTEPGEQAYGLSGSLPETPFAAAAHPQAGAIDPDNPYAAPSSSAPASFEGPYDAYPRDGPPWERDGPSIRSFIATLRSAYVSISLFYYTMRLEGGIGWPFAFALAGCYVGFVGLWLFTFMPVVLLSGGPDVPGPAEFLMVSACWLVLLPFLVVLHALMWSGMLHLSLMLVGGARFGFETTFRIVTYALGSVAPLLLIPFCGMHIMGIVQLAFFGIGVTYAHETSGGKGTLAVALPLAAGCCLGALFYALAFAFAVVPAAAG